MADCTEAHDRLFGVVMQDGECLKICKLQLEGCPGYFFEASVPRVLEGLKETEPNEAKKTMFYAEFADVFT